MKTTEFTYTGNQSINQSINQYNTKILLKVIRVQSALMSDKLKSALKRQHWTGASFVQLSSSFKPTI